MALSEELRQIDALKKELDSLGELSPEAHDKLWKKFRLEWNYNSNHIEGNTLTYHETELLLIFDKIKGEKDMREYEEMKAHDVAIKLVEREANDKDRPLTEIFVRELNRIILVRPFWKDAITPDGKSTKRQITIGEYKQYPNSVQLTSGEMFHYASPQETPVMMRELMAWYSENQNLPPVNIAAQLHYKFVRIHPFDDGNGRVSRLLMNYVLFRHSFPPVIIKSEDKKNYISALNKADAGDLGSFINYIAEQLIWSLEISIKAAKRESIEEPNDLDKRLQLIERKLADKIEVVKKTDALMVTVFNSIYEPLIVALQLRFMKMTPLFESWQYLIELRRSEGDILSYLTSSFSSFTDDIKDAMTQQLSAEAFEVYDIVFILQEFKKSLNKFSVWIDLSLIFKDYKYGINAIVHETDPKNIISNKKAATIQVGEWKYLEILDNEELQRKVEEISNRALDIVENKLSEDGVVL